MARLALIGKGECRMVRVLGALINIGMAGVTLLGNSAPPPLVALLTIGSLVGSREWEPGEVVGKASWLPAASRVAIGAAQGKVGSSTDPLVDRVSGLLIIGFMARITVRGSLCEVGPPGMALKTSDPLVSPI